MRKTICGLLLFTTAAASAAQTTDNPGEQSPQTAQAFLTSAIQSWGRASTTRLPVHYRIKAVRAQGSDCETFVEHNGGSILLNWRQVGEITTRRLEGSHPHLVKVRRPSGEHVQLYFSDQEYANRAFAAASFLKNFCDPAGGTF